MLIDCDSCTVRGQACDGCVVNLLLQLPSGAEGPGRAEADAIEVFVRAGFEVTVLEERVDERRPAAGRRRGRWFAA